MKITTLIGWPATTANGTPSGKPTVLSVVDVDGPERREQFAVFDAAKRLHQFPKGIRCLAIPVSENPSLAIFVSDEVSARFSKVEESFKAEPPPVATRYKKHSKP